MVILDHIDCPGALSLFVLSRVALANVVKVSTDTPFTRYKEENCSCTEGSDGNATPNATAF